MKEVSTEKWKQAMTNLQNRRAASAPRTSSPIDYKALLSTCHIGSSVLDVGCGSQHLKSCLPEGTKYLGIDAFPITPDTWPVEIEDDRLIGLHFDTVCAFAVLDGCYNLTKALHNMKALASQNVIILTGIGIEPDQYHTFKIEMTDLDSAFDGWEKKCTVVLPKVYLVEYIKPPH